MAFYIEFQYRQKGGPVMKETFYPGQSGYMEELKMAADDDLILMIQADGDELELIRNRFDNLPIAKGNICRWRGDMARFIVDNFPHL